MQDDLADLLEDQEEIQESLGRSYGGETEGLDEADLEAELAGLEEEFESAALEEPTLAKGGAVAASAPAQPNLPALGAFLPEPSARQGAAAESASQQHA